MDFTLFVILLSVASNIIGRRESPETAFLKFFMSNPSQIAGPAGARFCDESGSDPSQKASKTTVLPKFDGSQNCVLGKKAMFSTFLRLIRP